MGHVLGGFRLCPKHFNKDTSQKVRRLLSPAVPSRAHAISAQCLFRYHLMPVCPELLLPVGSCVGGAFLHIQPTLLPGQLRAPARETRRVHTARSEAHGLARAGRLLDLPCTVPQFSRLETACCNSLGEQGHSCGSRLWIPGHSLYVKTSQNQGRGSVDLSDQ